MDMRDFYYLAAGYMECTGRDCIKTFISWDSRMLNQLVDDMNICSFTLTPCKRLAMY